MASEARNRSGTEGGVSRVPGPDCVAGGAERPGRRRSLPARRVAAITAALAGVACLAAACSSPASPASRSSPHSMAARALAYSKCMRSHGIKDFPDPVIKGNSVGLKIGGPAGQAGSSDLNPSNPAFKAARQACRSLAPGGLNGPAPSAQELKADVKFAACMRSHGFPSFPDPDGHGVFDLPSAINPNSAQFGSASKTCEKQSNVHGLNMSQKSPGGPGGGS